MFCKEGKDTDDIENKLEEYLKELREDEKWFLVLPCRKNEIVLKEDEISFVERDKRVTRIHTDQGDVITTMKISEVYTYLDHTKFVLCHNSFIANLEKVRIFNRSEITMRTGDVIPVSRSHWKSTKEIFDNWAAKYMKTPRHPRSSNEGKRAEKENSADADAADAQREEKYRGGGKGSTP